MIHDSLGGGACFVERRQPRSFALVAPARAAAAPAERDPDRVCQCTVGRDQGGVCAREEINPVLALAAGGQQHVIRQRTCTGWGVASIGSEEV